MPHNPCGKATGLGYFRVRSPLLTKSRFLSFPAVTEMFHFAALAQEFRDQRLFDSYPELIAAFHAYQSRLVPRHPPYALNCLTTFIFGFSRFTSLPPLKLIHLGRSRSAWSALRLCIADFTTTELSMSYVVFCDPVFRRPQKGARMVLASSLGVNRSAQDFENRARSAHADWRRPGSNRQPLACKASALPIELRPRSSSWRPNAPNRAPIPG